MKIINYVCNQELYRLMEDIVATCWGVALEKPLDERDRFKFDPSINGRLEAMTVPTR